MTHLLSAALLVSSLSATLPPTTITVEPKEVSRLMTQPSVTLAAAALHFHAAAQQHKRAEDFALAKQLYERWLEDHATESEEPQIRFFYAELLRDLDEHKAAAEQFARSSRLDPHGRLGSRAAVSELYEWDKVLREASDDDRGGARRSISLAAKRVVEIYCGKKRKAAKEDCDNARAVLEDHGGAR